MANREFDGVKIKVEFNETANRQQISSGDNVNTLFGKIRKWLSDLKPVALSGSYNDLSEKPMSLPANGGTAETISEVLPISKGGTGETTAQDAFDTLVNGVTIGSENPTLMDDDYWISQYANGNDQTVNQKVYRRRKLSHLWGYIKTKAESLFVKKSGDDMSGTLGSTKTTGTYLAGNQGQAIINSKAAAGAYTMLDKLNSTNGYFTDGVYQGKRLLQYTARSIVEANTNAVTKTATLLDESGNTSFPGKVTASSFAGNATSATKATNDKNGKDIATTYATKTEVDELKKSVSDGKTAAANAITAKGVTTAADATFSTMAENIGKIETCLRWKNTSNGTYKFVQSGDRWIANNRGVNSSTATSTWKVTIPPSTNYTPISIGYRTATEAGDKLSISINGGTVLSPAGGIMTSEKTVTIEAAPSDHLQYIELVATYTKNASVHSYGDMAYVVLPPIGEQPGQYKYQSKSVTPSTSAQTIYSDAGFDGLYAVSVAATIASGNFKSGSSTFPADSSSTVNINVGFTPKILVIFGINIGKTYGNVTVYNSYFKSTEEYRMNLLANFSSNYIRIVNTIGSANAIIKSIGSTTVLSSGNDSHIRSQPMTWYAFE